MSHHDGVSDRAEPATRAGGDLVAGRRSAVAVGAVLALGLAVAIFWELAARRGWLDPFFWSKPSAIVYQLADWWSEGTSHGTLVAQAGVTFGEAALGLAIGSALGGAIGGACRRYPTSREVLGAVLTALTLPLRVALGAAFALGLGLGVGSKIAFASALVGLVAAGDALAGRQALTSLRLRFALALVGAVVGEIFMARRGLGVLIDESVHHFNASGVYAALIVLGAIALAGDGLLALIERRYAPRAGRDGESSRRD